MTEQTVAGRNCHFPQGQFSDSLLDETFHFSASSRFLFSKQNEDIFQEQHAYVLIFYSISNI